MVETVASDSKRIRFGWWNTSLTPPINKKRALPLTEDQITLAIDVIVDLLQNQDLDFLALCEVNDIDLNIIRNRIDNDVFDVGGMVEKKGSVQFDFGFIFRRSKLVFCSGRTLTHAQKERVKLGYQLVLQHQNPEADFHIFLAHWPSRIYRPENDPVRNQLGTSLAHAIAAIPGWPNDAIVVLLGDFNDEPFNESLVSYLGSSRDRAYVRSHKRYLYNPFWRLMGERDPHAVESERPKSAGTQHWREGKGTHWRTFDQIMFSSSCIRDGPWHLREAATAIVEPIRLKEHLGLRSGRIFDHFPVIAELHTSHASKDLR